MTGKRWFYSVIHFFDKYGNILDEHNFTADQIYSIKETVLWTVHKPSEVVSKNYQRFLLITSSRDDRILLKYRFSIREQQYLTDIHF